MTRDKPEPTEKATEMPAIDTAAKNKMLAVLKIMPPSSALTMLSLLACCISEIKSRPWIP